MRKLLRFFTWPYRKFNGLPLGVKLPVLIIFIIGTYFCFTLPKGVKLPENLEITTIANSYISFDVPNFYVESEDTKPVRKGETVRMLGYHQPGCLLWVETGSGERGYMPQEAFSTEMIAIDNVGSGESAITPGEKVHFIGRGEDNRLFVRKENGVDNTETVKKIMGEDGVNYAAIPIVLENRKYCIRLGHLGYATKDGFEKDVIGKEFQKVEKKYVTPSIVKNIPDGFKAVINYGIVTEPEANEDGKAKLRRPVLTVLDGMVTEVEYTGNADFRKILTKIPLHGQIIDGFGFLTTRPFFRSFSDGSLSILAIDVLGEKGISFIDSTAGKIIAIPIIIIILIILLLAFFSYFFGTVWAVYLFLELLLLKPWPFKPIGNAPMGILFVILGLCSMYIMTVLSTLFRVPLLIVVVVEVFLLVKALKSIFDLLSSRCPVCRNIDSFDFDHSEEGQPYITTGRYARNKRHVKTRTSYGIMKVNGTVVWKDSNSYRYKMDGHQTTLRTKDTTSTYEADLYDITFLVTPMTSFYKCRKCGCWKKFEDERRKELDKKHVGTETTTSTTRELM